MRKKLPDFILLFTILALVLSGLIMILSASSVKAEQLFSNSHYFFINQLKYLAVALVIAAVIYKFKYKKLKALAPYLLLISLVTLILVLIPGVGRMAGGSRRWLPLGPISFQPSELAKFTIVIYLAAYIDRNKEKIKNIKKGVLPPVAVIATISFLILLEPDLGTAITLAAVAAAMIFIGGIKISVLIILGLISSVLAAAAILIEPYRRQRLLTFLNPWQDPLDSGYHIIQSLLALGSGGLFGVGAGNSHQKFL
ncbi:MAG: FtsW/RodA/SpoVE family cell cycle protein, partial [Bacillota bacterium]